MSNLKTANIGGVSPAMPSYSDVTPRLSAPPTINPGTYGSSASQSSGFNLGSLLGSVGSLGSPLGWAGLGLNFANSLFNKNSAQKAQELQLQMFREQLKFNHDEAKLAFEREANYNSEVSQVQRMLQAGLNPALMFKGADSVNTSTASAPSAPDLKYPLMDTELGSKGIQTLIGSSDLLSRNESNLAMINQLKSLTNKYGVDSQYGKLMNKLFEMTFDNQVQDKVLKNQLLKSQIDSYVQDSAMKASQKVLLDTEVKNYVRKLGIEESRVAATIKSATISAAATRFSAKEYASASRYASDKSYDAQDLVSEKQYVAAAERNGIEHDKAVALAKYLKSAGMKQTMDTVLSPLQLIGNVATSLFSSSSNMAGSAMKVLPFAF